MVDWLLVYKFILPMMTTLAAAVVFVRAFMFWQKERSINSLAHLLIYLNIFIVGMARTLNWSIQVISLAYIAMSVALLVCNYYEWPAAVAFLLKKDEDFQAEAATGVPVSPAGTHTLADVANEETPTVTLEGTLKSSAVEPTKDVEKL